MWLQKLFTKRKRNTSESKHNKHEHTSKVIKDSGADILYFGILCVCLAEVTTKFQIFFPYRKWIVKLLRYCDKLRQWNEQTVVKNYCSYFIQWRWSNFKTSWRFEWFHANSINSILNSKRNSGIWDGMEFKSSLLLTLLQNCCKLNHQSEKSSENINQSYIFCNVTKIIALLICKHKQKLRQF